MKIMWILGFLLLASSAQARTFTEATISCRAWTITQDTALVVHATASCEAFDSTGRSTRTFDLDVFPLMTTQQRSQITTALGMVLQLVRTNESIPSPSPAQTP